jgi:hypothetical protein
MPKVARETTHGEAGLPGGYPLTESGGERTVIRGPRSGPGPAHSQDAEVTGGRMSREALLARTFVELADTLVDHFDVVELLTRLAR